MIARMLGKHSTMERCEAIGRGWAAAVARSIRAGRREAWKTKAEAGDRRYWAEKLHEASEAILINLRAFGGSKVPSETIARWVVDAAARHAEEEFEKT